MFPRGNVHPFVHPQGCTLFIVEKNGGANREFYPQGITSSLKDKFTPGGQLRPRGSKFAPRGEVKNGPLASIFPVENPFKKLPSSTCL
jgi:hypothetical protein